METWFAVGGLVVGVVSLLYAIAVNREQAHLKQLARTAFADLERGLVDVEDNLTLGLGHVDEVRGFMNTLARSEALLPRLDQITWAECDVTSAHRILKNLRKNLASLRIELFGARASHLPSGTAASEDV